MELRPVSVVRLPESPRGKGKVGKGCVCGSPEKVVRKVRRWSNPENPQKPKGKRVTDNGLGVGTKVQAPSP